MIILAVFKTVDFIPWPAAIGIVGSWSYLYCWVYFLWEYSCYSS